MRLGRDGQVAKTLGVTRLDDSIFHISSEEDILLVIQAAAIFVNKEHNLSIFHLESFHWYTRALLNVHHVSHLKQRKE